MSTFSGGVGGRTLAACKKHCAGGGFDQNACMTACTEKKGLPVSKLWLEDATWLLERETWLLGCPLDCP